MTIYAKVNGSSVEKYPYTDDMIRADNENVSFPPFISPETAVEFGAVVVAEVAPPVATPYQNVSESLPQNVGGVWTQVWSVSPASQDEITQRTDQAWSDLRKNRNDLLSASDWTQLADSPVDKVAWANYRKSLRDLPGNTSNPFSPVWPVPPT